MTTLRHTTLALAATLGLAWLAAGVPAYAGGGKSSNDEVGKKAAERAREECRQLLKQQGYKDIDLGDMTTREEGDRIIFEVSAKRKGDTRELGCTYDRQSKQTSLHH